MKKCSKCKQVKPVSEFYIDKRVGKPTSACKVCIYSTQLDYRDKNYFMTSHHNKLSQCRRSGIDYDLDRDYLESIWTGVCPVFDIKLTPRSDRHVDSTPHLDRIDPTKGYVKGNVAWLSRKANLIKSDATFEDIERVASWLKKVVDND